MKRVNSYRMRMVLVGFIATMILDNGSAKAATINQAPVADAGLSRYVARDPAVLDGTGSFDPDSSGPLTYTWRQIAGSTVVIDDANTAKPTISGFVQTYFSYNTTTQTDEELNRVCHLKVPAYLMP